MTTLLRELKPGQHFVTKRGSGPGWMRVEDPHGFCSFAKDDDSLVVANLATGELNLWDSEFEVIPVPKEKS